MRPDTLPSIDVMCETAYLRESVELGLSGLGFQIDASSQIKLVLDVDTGYAVRVLETLDKADLTLVVMSWNPCPEYLEYLWSLEPDALLRGDVLEEHDNSRIVSEIAYDLSAGKRYRNTPGIYTDLTNSELLTLRYTAFGLGNGEIAERLHLGEHTVKNTLNRVYPKLEIKGRPRLITYFWGIPQRFSDTS